MKLDFTCSGTTVVRGSNEHMALLFYLLEEELKKKEFSSYTLELIDNLYWCCEKRMKR
jgi:hypothetical protein